MPSRDFFVSYTAADRPWAEWIAWAIEAADYSVLIQAWDFRPGTNFVSEMQKGAAECSRTLIVLSPQFLKSGFTEAEWTPAFAEDPTGALGKLIPVRVIDCEPPGLLRPRVYINLVGLDEDTARRALLDGVKQGRVKPATAPLFPPSAKLPPVFPASVVGAFERFARCVSRLLQGYRAEHEALNDPAQLFVPLECEPQTEPPMAAIDALRWLRRGVDENQAHVILASYGMGKSFLAQQLLRELIEQYRSEPESAPMPMLLPLKEYPLPPGKPNAILDNLCDFALRHGFPAATREDFERLLREGRICVIFDGVDEIPMVQTEDPMRMDRVLEQLDLRRFGASSWVATARTGIFAAVLPHLRQSSAYRLACLLNWQPAQWRTYVFECQRVFERQKRPGIFPDDQTRDRFLTAVESTQRLRELTATPLLARMLVESWKVVLERAAELSLAGLYRHYTDYILTSKRETTVRGLDPEDRHRCLECAATHFFKTQCQSCTSDELFEIAEGAIPRAARREINVFIRIELQTYSLLVCDPVTAALGFSHRSFYEYYLALAILREVGEAESDALEPAWLTARLLRSTPLGVGEAGFVGVLLAEPENRVLAQALHRVLQTDTGKCMPHLRRNLLHMAVAEARAESHRDDPAYAPLASANLSSVEGAGLDVSGIDFSGCRLPGANLSGSTAVGADFSNADLRGADLSSISFTGCCFSGADLRETACDCCTFISLAPISQPPRLAGASFKKGVVIRHREDLALLEYAVNADGDGDDAWRTKTIRALRRGLIEPEDGHRP